MTKKEKQKTDPKREELQAQNADQETAQAMLQETQPTPQAENQDTEEDKLTDEEKEELRVEAYLKEKDDASECSYIEIFEGGYSCEEIIEDEGLEGVTPEQLRHFIRKQELLSHIHFMEETDGALTYSEMSEQYELDEDEVRHIVFQSNDKLSDLLEEGKSHAEIAKTLGLQKHVVEDYIKSYTFRAQALAVINRYFDRGFSAEQIAKSRKLEEGQVKAMIEGFKRKVFNYYTEKGKTIEQIAELTQTSVEGIIAAIGEDRRELQNRQAVKVQTLIQARKAGRNARLERLTDLRDILISEIKQRGLQEVAVDKIVSLYLKTEEAIGREENGLPQVVTSSKSNMWETKEFSVI